MIDPKWEIEDYLALAERARLRDPPRPRDAQPRRPRLRERPARRGDRRDDPRPGAAEVDVRARADRRRRRGRGRRRRASPRSRRPGHRPEHTAYLVADASRGESPGSSSPATRSSSATSPGPTSPSSPRRARASCYARCSRLLELDDFAEVWPGHIGGSLCGGAGMSEKPGTTIGFERRFNRLLALERRGRLRRRADGHLAPQPPNFKRIVELNRGPLLTRGRCARRRSRPRASRSCSTRGATLLDGREPREFDAAHVPGSINVTMVNAAVGTRAAWVVDPESDVVVTAASDEEAQQMARLLEAVGFRQIAGFLGGRSPGLAAGRASRPRRRPRSTSRRSPSASGGRRRAARRPRRRRVGRGPRRGLGARSRTTSSATASRPASRNGEAAGGRLLGREPQLDRRLAPPPRAGSTTSSTSPKAASTTSRSGHRARPLGPVRRSAALLHSAARAA